MRCSITMPTSKGFRSASFCAENLRLNSFLKAVIRRKSHCAIGNRLRDDETRRAERQKTDASLPDGVELSQVPTETSSVVRRTSSMPSLCEAFKRVSVRHYDYSVKLNRLQKRSLRFTWHRLLTRNGGKRVESVFEEVYDRLLKQCSTVRDMFTTRTFLSAMSNAEVATLRDHARETVKMFEIVIKNLDQNDKKRTDTGSDYDPRVIGRAHGKLRPYGFTGNFWEKFGETIIDIVLVQEAVRDLPGAGQAWVVLTACIVDQLRAGFDECRGGDGKSLLAQRVAADAAAHLDTIKDTPQDALPAPCTHAETTNQRKETIPRQMPQCPAARKENRGIRPEMSFRRVREQPPMRREPRKSQQFYSELQHRSPRDTRQPSFSSHSIPKQRQCNDDSNVLPQSLPSAVESDY